MRKLNQIVEIGLTLHVEEAALRVFKGGLATSRRPSPVRQGLNSRAFVSTFAQRGEPLLSGRWAPLWTALAAYRLGSSARQHRFAGLAVVGAGRRRSAANVTVSRNAVRRRLHGRWPSA